MLSHFSFQDQTASDQQIGKFKKMYYMEDYTALMIILLMRVYKLCCHCHAYFMQQQHDIQSSVLCQRISTFLHTKIDTQLRCCNVQKYWYLN